MLLRFSSSALCRRPLVVTLQQRPNFRTFPFSTSSSLALHDKFFTCSNAEELEQVIHTAAPTTLSSDNLVTAINLLGKLGSSNHTVVNKLIAQSKDQVAFTPSTLNDFCFGIGWGNLLDEMPTFVCQAVVSLSPQLSSHELSSIAMSFASLRHRDDGVCASLAKEVKQRDLSSFRLHELALLLKALGTLEFYDEVVCQKILDELLSHRREEDYTEDEIAMILDGFASFSYQPAQPLFSRLEKYMVSHRSMDKFTLSDLALILSSLESFQLGAPLLKKFTEYVRLTHLGDFSLDELSLILHILCSFHKTNDEKAVGLVKLVSKEFAHPNRKLSQLRVDDFAFVLNSLRTLDVRDVALARLFAREVNKITEEDQFQGNNMSILLHYLAWMKLVDPLLCKKVLALLETVDLSEFEGNDFALILDSLIQLKVPLGDTLCHAFAKEMIQRPLGLLGSPEDVVMILSSFETLGYRNDALKERLTKEI